MEGRVRAQGASAATWTLRRPAASAQGPAVTPGSTPGQTTGRPTRLRPPAGWRCKAPRLGARRGAPRTPASWISSRQVSQPGGRPTAAAGAAGSCTAAAPPPARRPAFALLPCALLLELLGCGVKTAVTRALQLAPRSTRLMPPEGRSTSHMPALRRLPLQISSKEEPRHYSAKIAWNARNNSHMPLLATGAPAINCAIKVRGAAGAGTCGAAWACCASARVCAVP